MTAETRWQGAALFDLSWNCVHWETLIFHALPMSVSEQKSTMGLGLVVTNKF